MLIDDNFYMQLAIDEAWKYQLLTYPNPAVGCVVVKNGKLLAIEAHQEAGLPHAEINALKSAFLTQYPNSDLSDLSTSAQIHQYLSIHHEDFFRDCTMYVTLEPCNHFGKTPPCANLLAIIKPKRVVIGTRDPNHIASGGMNTLSENAIEVTLGIQEQECQKLLSPFIMAQKNKHLNIFKIAQRLDGSFDGGYISSPDLLKFVHKLRTKIDLLCIGGNTVRIDRPTLDCRFVDKNQSPNICIFSNQTHFDTSIPLFQVQNRTVKIKNNFSILGKNNTFTLIEGGDNLFKLAYNHVDILLVLVSLSYSEQTSKFFGDTNLIHLYTQKIGSELLIWFKKGI